MTGDYFLDFHQREEGTLFLPQTCAVSIDCYDSTEVQSAVVASIEESLYALALTGMDLRALDGVTVAADARGAACKLQDLEPGVVPLEMSDQPETTELARTVVVRRGEEFRFHIVMRAGLGLMTLSSKPEEQALACGCIAHEAAHVEHEGHLYKTFPESYGRALDCGDSSRLWPVEDGQASLLQKAVDAAEVGTFRLNSFSKDLAKQWFCSKRGA